MMQSDIVEVVEKDGQGMPLTGKPNTTAAIDDGGRSDGGLALVTWRVAYSAGGHQKTHIAPIYPTGNVTGWMRYSGNPTVESRQPRVIPVS